MKWIRRETITRFLVYVAITNTLSSLMVILSLDAGGATAGWLILIIPLVFLPYHFVMVLIVEIILYLVKRKSIEMIEKNP